MAVDSKFFNIPFATSGDKTTIPEAVQPSGGISFTQGFGPDYERDPATDPLAKRVPRNQTNELYYEVTLAIKYLQLYGFPQYTSVADGGPANYPLSACVRYDAGAGMQTWRSIVATNTAVPGSDATKWAQFDAFSEASTAEAIAGLIGGKTITPRRLASAVQVAQWSYAVSGGTATALTATLSPVPSALVAGMGIELNLSTTIGANPTLNVNGLGAASILRSQGGAIAAGDAIAGEILPLVWDGAAWRVQRKIGNDVASGSLIARRIFTASGGYTPTAGTKKIRITATGGGGAGGGVPATSSSQYGAGGGGGAAPTAISEFTSGFSSVAITIGTGGSASAANGNPGTSTSFGGLLTVPGGGGGSVSGANSSPFVTAGAGQTLVSSGNFANFTGGPGGIAVGFSPNNNSSGFGGTSYWGPGAGAVFSTSIGGLAGTNYGSGGSGSVLSVSAGGSLGGPGMSGVVVVEEYA